MIKNRNLVAGQKLQSRYKGTDHVAEVIAGEDGKAAIKLEDGKVFKSVSAAGTAITGGAVNGWAFWSVVGGEDGVEATDSPKPRTRKKKDTESKDGDAPVGTPIPKEALDRARNGGSSDAQEETEEPSPVSVDITINADGENENEGTNEEESGDDENKITCQECGVEFDNPIQASEHFNEVHVA